MATWRELVDISSSQTLTNKTHTSPVLDTGVSGTAIKDEDNMASNSATHLATQQSIKAYVDAQVDTADALSEMSDVTITGTPADNEVLAYDSSTSEFINQTAAEVGLQKALTGATSALTETDLTASRALISGTGGKVEVSDVTKTELGYLDGVTSAIQTQLDGKQASGSYAALAGNSGQNFDANNLTVAGDLTVTGSDLTFDSVALTAIQTSGEPYADNDTSIMTSAAIDDRINATTTTKHASVQTGKHYRIVNTSFRADIGTDKYYLPLKSQDEQTVLTREENQEVAVCDGRLVSLTWRAEAFHNFGSDATVTFGVETNTVGSSYSGGYSVIETETVTVNHGDDQHLWHVVFDTAKHWDSTDMFTISMQSDTDITGSNERIFITLVIEDDWSTYLAGSTREIDTTP